MDDGNDPTSSSRSTFTLSNLSNGSPVMMTETESKLDYLSLSRLSANLEKLLVDPGYDYSDAEVVVEGVPVRVHRCLLASRSPFFHELFQKEKGGDGNLSVIGENGRPTYLMSDLVTNGCVRYEAFRVFLHYVYTGKLAPSPAEVSTCVDDSCTHDACRPVIDYAVELMYASATFHIKELVMLVQRRLLSFVDKAMVEDLVPIVKVSFHCQLPQLLSLCVKRFLKSDIDDVVLDKELPHQISTQIKVLRCENPTNVQLSSLETTHSDEKKIKQIHQALDSDDVALVDLLLKESDVTLDDASALHYAAAYCEPKVFKDVLSLGRANVNLKDSRGCSVLHVAARRKSPSILVALLNKGASILECMPDGQTAVVICRRSTRWKDYNQGTIQGQESNKDRMCIDVLEEQMRRISMSGYNRISSNLRYEELHMQLDYLEGRVRCAALLFPAEAKVAMEIADADWTPLYRGLASKGSTRYFRPVDINEEHSLDANRLQEKLLALCKTVEMGRRYFPHCSEVLDKFLVEMPDEMQLELGTEEERRYKVMYMELKEEVQKAFNKDIAQSKRPRPSPSSSSAAGSTLSKDRLTKKAKKK